MKYKEIKETLENKGVKFKDFYELKDIKNQAVKHGLMKEEDDFNEKSYKKFYGFKTIKTLIKDIPFLKQRKKFINEECLKYSKMIRHVSIF